jgi:PAS domain-containing protein
VEIISHPLSFEGRPAELVLVNDITERKRAEQALLESELKYRELVENANSIILRWTPAGVITFINEFGLKFFRLFGGRAAGPAGGWHHRATDGKRGQQSASAEGCDQPASRRV